MIDKLWIICKALALANADVALLWLLVSQLIGVLVTLFGGGGNNE